MLDAKLKAPDQYRAIYDFRSSDLSSHAVTTLFAVGGIAIAGPLAYFAAPALGGAVGGLMGLSGAAATTSGLALVGGGSLAAGGLGMAGGLAVLSVVGGGVGGALGAYVAGQYLSDVKGFDIYKVREGRTPAIITVSGFLSEEGEGHEGWQTGIDKHYPDHAWYHIEWEAKNLAKLGAMTANASGTQAFKEALVKAAEVATKAGAKVVGGAITAAQLTALSANPWHVAMAKAEKTGVLLADILVRCDRQRFILIGHSLGCRVIYSCLQTLATADKKRVAGVHLFAGAVHSDSENWRAASRALTPTGQIHSYRSDNDNVLGYLYKVGTFFMSDPIGRHRVDGVDQLINHDCSRHKLGHMDYKKNLANIRLGKIVV